MNIYFLFMFSDLQRRIFTRYLIFLHFNNLILIKMVNKRILAQAEQQQKVGKQERLFLQKQKLLKIKAN